MRPSASKRRKLNNGSNQNIFILQPNNGFIPPIFCRTPTAFVFNPFQRPSYINPSMPLILPSNSRLPTLNIQPNNIPMNPFSNSIIRANSHIFDMKVDIDVVSLWDGELETKMTRGKILNDSLGLFQIFPRGLTQEETYEAVRNCIKFKLLPDWSNKCARNSEHSKSRLEKCKSSSHFRECVQWRCQISTSCKPWNVKHGVMAFTQSHQPIGVLARWCYAFCDSKQHQNARAKQHGVTAKVLRAFEQKLRDTTCKWNRIEENKPNFDPVPGVANIIQVDETHLS